MSINKRVIPLLAGPLAFLIILTFDGFTGMSIQAQSVLASTVWIAIWWISEVVPIPVTSLLPIILFPLTGGLPVSKTTSAYGHKFVFLYIGGFILAKAIERWDLHRRIALNTVHFVGTDSRNIVMGFMLATAFLSMWISNTATSVMMLPIAVAVVSQLKEVSNKGVSKSFGTALMLGIGYSASIGGISTLIGTPPNLVLAGVVKEYYDIELIFSEWMLLVFPLSLTLLLITWLYLTRFAFKLEKGHIAGGKKEIRIQLALLGNLSKEERSVLIVFLCTALLWITRSLVFNRFLPALDDTIIAVAAALSLFLLPARDGKKVLDWKTAVKIPWGIVLLFGGGLAIAQGFKETGLAEWIGGQMSGLEGLSIFLILLAVAGMVNFLTEITSNVATTAMILPILAPVSAAMGVNPLIVMVTATISASCAFMLPVATPPNAVVFGSGYLKMRDMVRTGIVLNIISILLVTIYTYLFLPLLW